MTGRTHDDLLAFIRERLIGTLDIYAAIVNGDVENYPLLKDRWTGYDDGLDPAIEQCLHVVGDILSFLERPDDTDGNAREGLHRSAAILAYITLLPKR